VVSQNGTNEYHGSLFIKIDRPWFRPFQKVNNPNNPLRSNALATDLIRSAAV